MKIRAHRELMVCGVLLLSVACSLPEKKNQFSRSRNLDFQTTLELRNGNAGAADVLRILGEPGEKKDLGERGELWSYFDATNDKSYAQRLGIIVDPKSQKVESWTWLVKPGESLSELDTLKAIFKGQGKFKRHENEKWIGGHASIKETVFESSESGVSALMHKNTNKVFVISLRKINSQDRPIAGNGASDRD